MRSHTVPKKLLEQFAYFESRTKSLRLWRYERGRRPYGNASPSSATVVDGVYADPRDSEKEAELEQRLNQEFEDPVHQFIHQAGYRTFAPTRAHIVQLAAYVSLLFHRSKARRAATRQQVEATVQACQALLADEEKLRLIAGKWTLDIIDDGHVLSRTVSVDEVRRTIEQTVQDQLACDQLQHTYAGTMERALARIDVQMLNGNWNLLHTVPEDPFVIGDAPVITWERRGGLLLYGQGFSQTEVEVFLPISPAACLHIQPAVNRTRPVLIPTTHEVNAAQASFASDYCFTNIRCDSLDATLQPNFGRTVLGVNAFSIRHKNYTEKLLQILMNRGR